MTDAIQQTAPEQTKLALTSFDAIPEIEIAHRKRHRTSLSLSS